MFPARTASEVVTSKEYLTLIERIVEGKLWIDSAVGTKTPVPEQVLSEKPFVPGRCFEEAGRDDLVGVDVLDRERHA